MLHPYVRKMLKKLICNKLSFKTTPIIEELCMGLFNKSDPRREVQITILPKQICYSLSREVSYIGGNLGEIPLFINF